MDHKTDHKKNITALSNKEQNMRKFLGNVSGDEECLKPKQHWNLKPATFLKKNESWGIFCEIQLKCSEPFSLGSSTISYTLMRTRTCTCQGARNVSFSKDFAWLLNLWFLSNYLRGPTTNELSSYLLLYHIEFF